MLSTASVTLMKSKKKKKTTTTTKKPTHTHAHKPRPPPPSPPPHKKKKEKERKKVQSSGTKRLYIGCCVVCSGNNRLYPFNITVDGQPCASVPSGTTRSVDVTCSNIMYGQRVRITRTTAGDFLNMCEFQVLGKFLIQHV